MFSTKSGLVPGFIIHLFIIHLFIIMHSFIIMHLFIIVIFGYDEHLDGLCICFQPEDWEDW